MKNRYFILSVLFWAITSVLFAVTLPSSSYTGSFMVGGDSYETQLGTGTSMIGSTLLASASVDTNPAVCTEEGVQGDPADCGLCCVNSVYKDCISKGGTTTECGALNEFIAYMESRYRWYNGARKNRNFNSLHNFFDCLAYSV